MESEIKNAATPDPAVLTNTIARWIPTERMFEWLLVLAVIAGILLILFAVIILVLLFIIHRRGRTRESGTTTNIDNMIFGFVNKYADMSERSSRICARGEQSNPCSIIANPHRPADESSSLGSALDPWGMMTTRVDAAAPYTPCVCQQKSQLNPMHFYTYPQLAPKSMEAARFGGRERRKLFQWSLAQSTSCHLPTRPLLEAIEMRPPPSKSGPKPKQVERLLKESRLDPDNLKWSN